MIDEDHMMQLCARDAGAVNREKLAAKNSAYYEKNKDKIVASSKAYYAANKEKASAQKKAHYEANKDQVLAKRKEYYAANKERVKARAKTYSEENKEQLATTAKVYREANKAQQAARGKTHYEKNKEQVKARSKAYYEANTEHVATTGKLYREANRPPTRARRGSEEHSRKMSAAQQGIPYDEWESFAKSQLYCPKFNEGCKESNRMKYGRRCFLTGLPEAENGQKLSVHHCDMNKQQGCDGHRWRLVPLCRAWHGRTHNETWESRIGYLLEHVWS